MLKTHLFSRLNSLTNCFAEYDQRTLYGALIVSSSVTAPYKLSFYYYYYNYIFITIISYHSGTLENQK